MSIRIAVVDDHPLVRAGIRLALSTVPGLTVVGEAADGAEAVDLAERVHPDVILMDINMPQVNGIEATRRIARSCPGVKVIGLSMHDEGALVSSMRDAGAVAHVGKGAPLEVLVTAIRETVGLPCTALTTA